MNYYEQGTGYSEDGLIGGHEVAAIVHNVKVSSEVVRGHLICEDSSGAWAPVTVNDDASKPLAIATTDFEPSEDNDITPAYVSGIFNAEKVFVGTDAPYASLGKPATVLIGDEIDYETFKQALRVQGIWLSSLKDY